ncbi:NADH dehydrogenase [ubiquinone] 1 beta subcomplex subunit 8 mitochondrial [Zea mays]|uniref:NADH dehydrogenase [ubiquinone] 1 beta subcomplex subunit 8 mitochondrial n=1 Tax=Zea mays TaxID=4577 RepID=A0A1D6K868_MAIZE|nr:NADH dehydrogenase [ubiquinone] 1 beta subcomplex subunit 8 mitochondrial [Zea mays]
MCCYVRQAPAQLSLGRGAERLLRAVHRQAGGPHGRRQRRPLGLFWAPHSTTAPSRRLAHHPPEAQPATGVAHPVVQRPGVLPC